MEHFRFNKRGAMRFGIFFIFLIVTYILALWIAAALPSEKIKAHIAESATVLPEEQGWYDPIFFQPTHAAAMLDYLSDATILNGIYNIDNKSPLQSAFLCKQTYISYDARGWHGYSNNQITDLNATIQGKTDSTYLYARYWHGYLAIWRPLLIFFDYIQLRAINIFLFLVLMFTLIIFTAKKLGAFVAIALSLSLLYVNFFCIPLVFQYLPVYYITLITSLVILFKNIQKESTYLKIMFITASLTAYFDLMTAPIVTFGIPFIFILLKQDQYLRMLSWKQITGLLVRFGSCWILGYSLTWGIKWLLSYLLYPDIFQDVMLTIQNHTNNTGPYAVSILRLRSMALQANITLLFNIYTVPTIIMASIMLIIGLIFRKKKYCIPIIFTYLFISMIPYFWYLVCPTHTKMHDIFTYRGQMITIFALLLAFKNSVDIESIKKKIIKK
jgi:hypothetical protein